MNKLIGPRVIPAMFAIVATLLVGGLVSATGDAPATMSGNGLAITRKSDALLQAQQPQPGGAPEASLDSSITYQGRLKDGPNPANGQYDFVFRLFDSASGGTQLAPTIIRNNQSVREGLVTASLDFGSSAFQGQTRYLEVAVRPAAGGSFTVLTPRQAISPAPYAMGLRPGALVTDTGKLVQLISSINFAAIFASGVDDMGVWGYSIHDAGVQGQSSNDTGVRGISANGTGVHGSTTGNGTGVYGQSVDGLGVHGTSDMDIGVVGESNSARGVFGRSASSIGIHGESTSSTGVFGQSSTGMGVYGLSDNLIGVLGEASDTGTGVRGNSEDGVGVYGSSDADDGVRGTSDDGFGAHGSSTTDVGVRGESEASTGVHGSGITGVRGEGTTTGVWGQGTVRGVYGQGSAWGGYFDGGVYAEGSAIGVVGESEQVGVRGIGTIGVHAQGIVTGVYALNSYTGVYAQGSFAGVHAEGGAWAGLFDGNILVTGACIGCLGPDKIDHPLDPANKYLSHALVESPDMLNIYNGNVVTGANGEAVVTLPGYFEALNKDFRYQLTVVGQFAQAVIWEKIENNHFTIKTDKPNVEVSWQVTGIRKDAYAEQHPIVVEEDKGEDRGRYLHPTEHDQPESMGIDHKDRQPGKEQP